MKAERRTLWQTFQVPFWLGLMSIVGLVSALVGDGGYDVLSWAVLGAPVLVVGWFWFK